jgi:hypothetical protein
VILLPPATPRFGVNYGLGSIGFVHKKLELSDGVGAIVSGGIEWFTRFWRQGNPAVTHVLGVTGDRMCIEANADGVDEDSLDPYFNDPIYTVYFRKPLNLTPAIADAIVDKALTYVGCKYDDVLIVADALNNTLLGHILNGLTHDQVAEWLDRFLADPKKEICDEVWHLALAAQPQYAGLGVLREPAAMDNPQQLFGDELIFANEVTVIPGCAP